MDNKYINSNYNINKLHNISYVNRQDPMNKFLPFGRYQLDLKQLKGGKLQFRSKKGFPIKGLENRRLSSPMKKIIDDFISGESVNPKDIDTLKDDEKDYLSQMAEKVGINDRLKIPSPTLSKIQSDINKFNVMRGMLIAGNDNENMIKEFKVLLLKLSTTGHISKTEANEIFTILLQLGY